MTEKNVRIKIRSVLSDLAAFDMCAKVMGEEHAVEVAEDEVIEMSTDATIRDDGKNIELKYIQFYKNLKEKIYSFLHKILRKHRLFSSYFTRCVICIIFLQKNI